MKKIIPVLILVAVLIVFLFGVKVLNKIRIGNMNKTTSLPTLDNSLSSASSTDAESSGGITLNVSSPNDNEVVNASSLTVAGVTTPNAEVSVNEIDSKADSNGKFNATISLDAGANTISVVANDSAGNFIEKDVNVTNNFGQ